MNTIPKFFSVCCLWLTASAALAQSDSLSLPAFHGIIASPFIDVVLIKGNREYLRLEYSGVERNKINVEISDGKLNLFLERARYIPRHNTYRHNGMKYTESAYAGARVVAYVTYVNMDYIEQRGAGTLHCQDVLKSDKLRIALYGKSQVELAGISTDKLKVALYGENQLTVNSGQAFMQQYRSYGENKVNAENLPGQEIRTSLFGESRLKLNASGKISVSSLGESRVSYSGMANLYRGLIIGENTIIRTEK